jgi:hypothetical protein
MASAAAAEETVMTPRDSEDRASWPPPGARGFRLRLGRAGTLGGWARVERGEEEPELPLVGFATSGEADLLSVSSSGRAPAKVWHRRAPLRRKRPVVLREWARLFGLTFAGIGAIVRLEGDLRGGMLALALAAVLLAYFRLTPADPTASLDFPYERGRRRAGQPPAELPFSPLERPLRARRAAALALAVGGTWIAADPSASGALTGLPLAAIAATWAYEIPIRPPRWVGIASGALGGLVAFVAAGVAAMLSPLSDGPVLQPALAAFTVSAAFSYVLLGLGVVIHRIERWDLSSG